jgi:hypothetical protein
MNYNLLDYKTHALEAILLLPVLPGRVIIDLVHSVNQANLSRSKRDNLTSSAMTNILILYLTKTRNKTLNYHMLKIKGVDISDAWSWVEPK